MSKKTRKKSSKPSPRKSPGQSPKKSSKASPAKPRTAKAAPRSSTTPAKQPAARKSAAKKSVAKPAGTAVAKSGKTAKSASAKASHKPSSKPLKSDPPVLPEPDSGAELVEGAMAPGFKLQRDGGESVSLADYAGQKLVLFFYPRADTPGCTREAIDFTRLRSAFADQGTAVLGVSADTVKAQESFRDKHQLAVPLISDENHEMLEAYGAWGEKSMYGRTFLGIIRSTVLVGPDGRVAKIWRNVKVDGHADDVLAAAQAL
jgi:thioredoxin-dependent peroxiredoxin